MLLLKLIPVPSPVCCLALGCSEEALVATHVIMFYENPKAKANVPGSGSLCVALVCMPAFAPSRGIAATPFSLTRLTPLMHLHTGLFRVPFSQLSNTLQIFRH